MIRRDFPEGVRLGRRVKNNGPGHATSATPETASLGGLADVDPEVVVSKAVQEVGLHRAQDVAVDPGGIREPLE
jgi:hypothetical protein